MPIATVNGTQLRLRHPRVGEPVVMVMGSGSGGRVWEMHQVPALVADGYQVVTFDDRGVSQPEDVEPTVSTTWWPTWQRSSIT